MKKFLLILALIPFLAQAQHYHHHNHRPHWRYSGGTWNWMVPALIGGIVVYEASKQPAPQPIIIQQQQPQENCTPWTEVQTPDGRIYRERTCQK
jgi:hypothetical protein